MLPATDSAVTVSGRGPFADLEITVNQTAELTNQAISISWTGATATRFGPGPFAAQYLQMFQCWGEPDDTAPENPGPPPEQCVQGATLAFSGAEGNDFPNGFATTRIISRPSWENYDPDVGVIDDDTNVWVPFRSVDGTVIDIGVNPDFVASRGANDFWLNPYFDSRTTNEIAGAKSQSDGSGIELFEVQTGVQSAGLGCGQNRVLPGESDPRTPRCWLVIVPRSDPLTENEGTPFGGEVADRFGVMTSPLTPTRWQHRIAVELDFTPVDATCSIGDATRRISGNWLSFAAALSWSPALCTQQDLPPFSYSPVSDANARLQLAFPSAGAPGMVVSGGALESTDPADPILHAPLTASGLTIGFNIEREVDLTAPDEEIALDGIRIENLNLTPRLVAKLLTQSYQSQLSIRGQLPEDSAYDWIDANPTDLTRDPDFLRFNEEFELLRTSGTRTMGGLVL
ncbi:MAG: hypothetical protein AAF211_32505, partial [Myxococcota bacterium]